MTRFSFFHNSGNQNREETGYIWKYQTQIQYQILVPVFGLIEPFLFENTVCPKSFSLVTDSHPASKTEFAFLIDNDADNNNTTNMF